ncbi:MAG TPA: response regulator [Polyangia bacterium]|nr:response regulator [Polyangia bacterium]
MAEPNHTVLVIEDDSDVRNALAELLSTEGYDVSLTADGGEALEKLRGGLRPSVILLDLMMPNVDGWDFRRAQLDDPSLAAIPVILLTASGFRPDSMHSERGRLEMLPKPVQAHVLLDTLERMASLGADPDRFRERPTRI